MDGCTLRARIIEAAMTGVIERFGVLGVFLLMVPESACIPIPSELTLLFSGFAVHQGWMSLPAAVLAATAGNLVGSLLAYALGASHLLNRVVGVRELLGRWEGLLERHGTRAVFVARLLPLARTFVSLPAGAQRIALDQVRRADGARVRSVGGRLHRRRSARRQRVDRAALDSRTGAARRRSAWCSPPRRCAGTAADPAPAPSADQFVLLTRAIVGGWRYGCSGWRVCSQRCGVDDAPLIAITHTEETDQ